jgi:hypothetical protein
MEHNISRCSRSNHATRSLDPGRSPAIKGTLEGLRKLGRDYSLPQKPLGSTSQVGRHHRKQFGARGMMGLVRGKHMFAGLSGNIAAAEAHRSQRLFIYHHETRAARQRNAKPGEVDVSGMHNAQCYPQHQSKWQYNTHVFGILTAGRGHAITASTLYEVRKPEHCLPQSVLFYRKSQTSQTWRQYRCRLRPSSR